MSAKYFIDTNVFVYSFDSAHPAKQKAAQQLIDRALSKQAGLISFQVVQEFLSVALRKFEKPLSRHEARSYLDAVLVPLCEVFPSTRLYQQALDRMGETHLSFYDALIVTAASEADCALLYTEDLQHGQRIGKLTIQNPFVN